MTVGKRRLAYEKAKAERKLEAARKAEAETAQDNEAALKEAAHLTEEVEEVNLDVEAISEQTHLLFTSATAILGIVLLWSVWSDVFYSLNIMEGVKLYTSQTGVGPDGKPVIKNITLFSLFAAGIILVATWVLARTIPAVVQIVRFRRFMADAGSRLAFGQIARYIILAVGIGLVLGKLGLSWSKFSVVAAAMTLGLSWGLQDIFSNFVSGIILLLERPVRVGDIVTVAGVTGTVSRIQIRATTVINFDRQELIVPNKSFLSEKVTNWSLSDDVNRVVVSVGISYKNDPEKAQDLLLKIAQENSLVMKTPGPSVVFSGFGADSLDFNLRVFVGLSNMIPVQNQLRHAITREFAQAGIEIPFGQRDVHLDSLAPLEVKLIEKA